MDRREIRRALMGLSKIEDVDDDKEFALLQTLILARFSAYVLAEVFDKK